MPARAHCAFAGRPWCLPMDNAAIDRLMHEGLRQKTFPGAVLLAAIGNEPFFFKAYGHADLFSGRPMTPHTVFDLASLTKPLATTLAVASLVRRGMIDLDRPIGHELSIPDHNDKAVITPRQLLCHQSGLPAHRLFYMQLKRLTPKLRRSALLDLLLQTSLDDLPGRRTLYSDLGFMLLCRLIETVAGCRLDRYLMSWVYGPLGLAEALFFVDLVGGGRPAGNFAATELCPVRNRLLVGEVHDDNAWYSGGVDGHAGLFGTAEAVFRLLRYLVRLAITPRPCPWDSTVPHAIIPVPANIFRPAPSDTWGIPVCRSGWILKKMSASFCSPTVCIPPDGTTACANSVRRYITGS